MKLSIVIPTYQAHDIRPLLTALTAQSVQPFEVIVVENGNPEKTPDQPAPDTRPGFKIKFIHEPLAGLNRARNVGVFASQGSHIALIDDDCQPESDWLENIINAHRGNPRAGVVGGRVVLEYKANPPFWLNSEFRRSLAELDYGEEQRSLERWQHLVGANLSFSRNVFDEVGGFQESLGLKGGEKIIRANDEAEFIHKACLRGLPGAVYEGRAAVHHQIPGDRLEFDYFLQRRYGQGVSDIEYDLLHSGIEKAFHNFYSQVFRARWHYEELKADAASLPHDEAEELLWRGMFARILYLMGARERLVSRQPEYTFFKLQVHPEAVAFQRGKNLYSSISDAEQAARNALLQRIMYQPAIRYSPFLRVALLAGFIAQVFNTQLVHVQADQVKA